MLSISVGFSHTGDFQSVVVELFQILQILLPSSQSTCYSETNCRLMLLADNNTGEGEGHGNDC